MARDKTLTPKQWTAIVALLESDTQAEAARKAGVDRTTLHRWFEDDLFARTYQEGMRSRFKESMLTLQKLSAKAVSFLESVMLSQAVDVKVKLAASRHILTHARAAVESDELSKRLDRLEDLINAVEKTT
ncbi:MAG: hypothetical protein IH624_07530 [Phycisphaerae bacterium]|nr:hypothetical protein [Phycisphaerae bacterium]